MTLTRRGRLVGHFLLALTVVGFLGLLVTADRAGQSRRCDALAASGNVVLLEQYRCAQ